MWLDLLTSAKDRPIPALLAINKSEILDPWSDASVTHIVELYLPNFTAGVAVSALTGEQVDEFFFEAASIACAANTGIADLVPGILSEDAPPPESKCC
jgi:hypothetical protein